MSDALRVISYFAADQWGLITSRQAADLGVSRVQLSRLSTRGMLQRLIHGVYLVAATPEDQTTMLRAIWLSLDPARTAIERIAAPHEAGVVSYESAASLHQMGDLQAYQHHLTFPSRKQTRRDDVVLHQGALGRDDVVLVDGLPCTSPERTIADLLGVGYELEHVAQVLSDGVEQGKVDLQRLHDSVERSQGGSGKAGAEAARQQLAELMAAAGVDEASLVDRAAGSALGTSIAAKWLENAGLGNLFNLPQLSIFNSMKMPTVIDPELIRQIRSLPNLSGLISQNARPSSSSTESWNPGLNQDEAHQESDA